MDDSAATVVPRQTTANATTRDPRKAEFELGKLRKRLRRLVGQAIADYAMIDAGDRVMVCLSGGKDSYGLLDVLLSLQKRSPRPFDDRRRQPRPEAARLSGRRAARATSRAAASQFRIVEQDTYSVVKRLIPEGATMCSLCSRLRRGVLYRVAGEIGATKIALGHHRDDILATFFLNLFHGGKLKTMPPKLVSDDGMHVVIRPLAYVRERDLARYAAGVRRSRSFRARCADRRRTCSACRWRRCCANGRSAFRAASNRSSMRWATSLPTHLLDRAPAGLRRGARHRRCHRPMAIARSTPTRLESAEPAIRFAPTDRR